MLRFYALWDDDTDSLNRETRTVIIQYFLVDDTVAIIEVHKPNSGRDPFPVLMCRQKLPKKIKPESGEQHYSFITEINTIKHAGISVIHLYSLSRDFSQLCAGNFKRGGG